MLGKREVTSAVHEPEDRGSASSSTPGVTSSASTQRPRQGSWLHGTRPHRLRQARTTDVNERTLSCGARPHHPTGQLEHPQSPRGDTE